jgi:hypothetical protein
MFSPKLGFSVQFDLCSQDTSQLRTPSVPRVSLLERKMSQSWFKARNYLTKAGSYGLRWHFTESPCTIVISSLLIPTSAILFLYDFLVIFWLVGHLCSDHIPAFTIFRGVFWLFGGGGEVDVSYFPGRVDVQNVLGGWANIWYDRCLDLFWGRMMLRMNVNTS